MKKIANYYITILYSIVTIGMIIMSYYDLIDIHGLTKGVVIATLTVPVYLILGGAGLFLIICGSIIALPVGILLFIETGSFLTLSIGLVIALWGWFNIKMIKHFFSKENRLKLKPTWSQ